MSKATNPLPLGLGHKETIRIPRRLFDRSRIVATPGALAACKPDYLCVGPLIIVRRYN